MCQSMRDWFHRHVCQHVINFTDMCAYIWLISQTCRHMCQFMIGFKDIVNWWSISQTSVPMNDWFTGFDTFTTWSVKGFSDLSSEKMPYLCIQWFSGHCHQAGYMHGHTHNMPKSLAVCALNVKQGIPQMSFKFQSNYYIQFEEPEGRSFCQVAISDGIASASKSVLD